MFNEAIKKIELMVCSPFCVCRTENSEMHQAKDKVKREQQLMYRENERLTKVIERLEREINGYDVNFCREKMFYFYFTECGQMHIDLFLSFFQYFSFGLFEMWKELLIYSIIKLFYLCSGMINALENSYNKHKL